MFGFFFQAEDGIRDYKVTGVQTCALPIYDGEIAAAFRDLGGHDLEALVDAYRSADAEVARPSVIFAYTIKGWNLPTEGQIGRASCRERAESAEGAGECKREGRSGAASESR